MSIPIEEQDEDKLDAFVTAVRLPPTRVFLTVADPGTDL
jgi:hypothetical protein